MSNLDTPRHCLDNLNANEYSGTAQFSCILIPNRSEKLGKLQHKKHVSMFKSYTFLSILISFEKMGLFWRLALKRRLVTKNKRMLSAIFKRIASVHQVPPVVFTSATFASIAASKLRGQRCYQLRLARQSRMNARQLKKCRQRQISSGLVGSRYAGMCKTQLKPAGFVIR